MSSQLRKSSRTPASSSERSHRIEYSGGAFLPTMVLATLTFEEFGCDCERRLLEMRSLRASSRSVPTLSGETQHCRLRADHVRCVQDPAGRVEELVRKLVPPGTRTSTSRGSGAATVPPARGLGQEEAVEGDGCHWRGSRAGREQRADGAQAFAMRCDRVRRPRRLLLDGLLEREQWSNAVTTQPVG